MIIGNSSDLTTPYKRGMWEGERTVGLPKRGLNLQECPRVHLQHVLEHGFAGLSLCAITVCLRCHTV